MEDFLKTLKQALPDKGDLPPPRPPGGSAECIPDDMMTAGDPKGLLCCSQNGTHGTWRTGFFCMSKQGLTLTSTYMGFPLWFWVLALVILLTIVMTKILLR